MSKTPSEKNPRPPGRAAKPWVGAAVVLAAAAILAAVSWWPRDSSPAGPASSLPNVTATNTSTATVSVPAAKDLQFLKGRWRRPDGGYVIEVRQVDANGQMDAGYFNPSPIRVTSAVAKQDGGATKVFLELTDVNYPGCTYNLTYVPDRDVLVGIYFQAALKETFEVAFERLK